MMSPLVLEGRLEPEESEVDLRFAGWGKKRIRIFEYEDAFRVPLWYSLGVVLSTTVADPMAPMFHPPEGWRVDDFAWCPALHEISVAHDGDAVCETNSLEDVVGHDDEGLLEALRQREKVEDPGEDRPWALVKSTATRLPKGVSGPSAASCLMVAVHPCAKHR